MTMTLSLSRLALPLALLLAPAPAQARPPLTRHEVARQIIAQSVSDYLATGHPCACPYNVARNGSTCGRRSAYSRPGGEAPICYETDVTDAMVAEWRANHPQ